MVHAAETGTVGAAAGEPAGRCPRHLLVREGNEADGTWRASVSRVQETGRRVPTVVQVRAGGLRPPGLPEAYE